METHLNLPEEEFLTEANILFLAELKEAVAEVNLIKTGKVKGRPAEELLKEL
jgi:hypothetical protein